METAPDANNKKVVFQGKVTREHHVGDGNKKVRKLGRRGIISDKQLRRFGAKKDR